MPNHRKRFRVENVIHGDMPDVAPAGEMAMHDEVMGELRAIRAQMAGGIAVKSDDAPVLATASAEASATLETYKAQIEQCEKLKSELDLIHQAISRTKQEIAALHGKSFDGAEMARVTGELGAIVGGTEEATQTILTAAETIDQAASGISGNASPDQQRLMCEDIQERVVTIFEACNFQDLTGQRISKVMSTMRFIEHHINVMMEIWGGVDEIRSHGGGAIVDDREGDDRLLNGPKCEGDIGHASQDDIDAMFG